MADKNTAPGGQGIQDKILDDAIGEFNKLFSNMFRFGEEDKAAYAVCYKAVFGDGMPPFSYMGATFYAQFAAEILVGMLASNPFRRFIENALTEEAAREVPGEYWEKNMGTLRFGIEGKDYTKDTEALMVMMNESYTKIMALNNWYGTDAGKAEFDMYCLSKKAVRNIKRAIAEFPYLIRRFDYERQFAGEIMEYAGIVAAQIRETASEAEANGGN